MPKVRANGSAAGRARVGGAVGRREGGGSKLKGQQQRESNPQSRVVQCGAFCRRAR